jgi:outer membrane receptor protein involved in Fe transport
VHPKSTAPKHGRGSAACGAELLARGARVLALLACVSAAPCPALDAAAAPPPAAPADQEIEARFRCPESYATEKDRAAALEELRTEIARRHPQWTPRQAEDLVRDLLAARHCSESYEETLVVTGKLEDLTSEIVPSLGATVHTIGRDQIEAIPQGDDAPFQQVLLRSPGVVQDSFGEVHVRGEHGNLQYRINGILLPESLNGFAQEVDTRFVESVSLTDGALPAQFGFRNSGIADITTKTGARLRGGEVSLYGGSFGLLQPSFQVGNAAGKLELYVSGSLKQTALGVENPTSGTNPRHDASDQGRGVVYLTYRVDPASRVTLLVNVSAARFQIPDTPGLVPRFAVAGAPPLDSAKLDERQREQNDYAVVAYQARAGDLHYQLAAFTRLGRIAFTPDAIGDLAFDGVASRVAQSTRSTGTQLDASYPMGGSHTLRFGLLVTAESARRDTDTAVLPATDAGQQLSGLPLHIADNHTLHGLLAGLYLQDEWRPAKAVTVNYGLRLDRADAILHEGQLSPRLNVVWKIGGLTSVHLGYARYFTPPSLQFIAPASVALYRGTTNAPETFADSPPRAERADYFDFGLIRELAPGWQLSLDAFDKIARNLIDLGQFGNAIILAPFNYRQGRVHGVELSTTARAGAFSLYANAAYVFTRARDIESAQFEFPAAQLAYIQAHDIRLDHEGEVSASAGAAYGHGAARFFVDLLYCSGLRRGFANLYKLPAYYPLNLGFEQTVVLPRTALAVKLRVDMSNVLDQVYRLRDGTGIGIAASQYGPRRGFYAGAALLF